MSLSKLTKYCACHEKWISWLTLVTHETLFAMRGATSVITCPNSPNTAPATKNESHDWSLSHMKCYLQCAEQQVSLSKLTKYCACHEKWISWLILVTHETLFTMRGATGVIVQTHQILRLPRKMNLMIDPCHTWNAIYNARSNKCHCPNSPNTAPATKNESHDWSLSHMKRYLQCAEQQVSLSKLTKYCACHEKWISWLILVTHEMLFTMRGATGVIVQTHQILRLPRKMNLMIDPCHTWNAIYNARSNKCHCPNSPNTAPATKNDRPESQRNLLKTDETSFPMRGRSDHDPSMIRPWNRHSATRLATEVTFHAHHEHFVLKNTTFRAPAIIPNFTEYCACHEKWHLHFTKYCACHEKWISWLILDTNETLFTMRGATCVIVQTHQILRLPRKMTVPNLKEIYWKRMKRHFQCAADPTMIRPWNRHSATRLATEVTFHARHEHFVLKNATFRAPAIIPNFTEYCACHEKWHSNFTIYCACHEKWHLHFTKYCACHEKWISWLILDTNETLFTMRGATCVIVQTHQILRLPRKMTVPNLKEICWKRMKRHFQCAADPRMIREWSDHETVSPQPASQPRLPFTPTTSILYWKIQHFALRLSFQISPNTAPATKSDTRTSPNTAPATKSDTCTSPNTAPATKNESHDWSLTQMKRYLQCAEQHAS